MSFIHFLKRQAKLSGWSLLPLVLPFFFAPAALAQSSQSTAYTFTTLAGKTAFGSADGVGNNVQFNVPVALTMDARGNLYIADSANSTIRMMTPAGVVTTIAGYPGTTGFADGINNAARFNHPSYIALDAATNLYVSDFNNYAVRELSPQGTNWVVHTLTVTNTDGSVTPLSVGFTITYNSPIDFHLRQTETEGPGGIVVDAQTNLYVTDVGGGRILRLSPAGTNWTLATIAGSFENFGTNDGLGTNALFTSPRALAMDKTGALYVGDDGDPGKADSGTILPMAGFTTGSTINHIRKLVKSGTNWQVSTVVLSTNATLLNGGMVFDANNNLFIADSVASVMKVTNGTNATTFAGMVGAPGANDGIGVKGQFFKPRGLALDANGNIFVADSGNNEIRQISIGGVVATLAGFVTNRGSANGVGTAALFFDPNGGVVGADGNLYVVDTGNNEIRQVTPAGRVSSFAGSTNSGNANGLAGNAQFMVPVGITVDRAGNFYVTDAENLTIRKITPAAVVSTIAGSPNGNFTQKDGLGTNATFFSPLAIATDAATNLYVVDEYSLRRVSPSGTNWQVTTIYTATNSDIVNLLGVTADGSTNIYLAYVHGQTIINAPSQYNIVLLRMTKNGTNGPMVTLTDNPTGSADGPLALASFNQPANMAADTNGNIFLADTLNSTIREISVSGSNYTVSTIGGVPGNAAGRDGAGVNALFNQPGGIAVDPSGIVYVVDTGNNSIRQGVFTQYGSANTTASTPPVSDGKLQVFLLPPEAGGQWRFPWETAWHDSGFVAANLVPGNYPLEFRNIPGYLAVPPRLTTTNGIAVSGVGTNQYTNMYYPTPGPSLSDTAGSLTILLGANPPTGAGWRFLGDSGAFLPSGFTTNLVPGTYLLEFAGPFANRATPPNASIQIFSNQPTFISVSYPFASSPPGTALLPVPVPPAQTSDVSANPFGFNGQIESDVGYGSGAVVQSNVVLTAAHLVFHDDTQSYVSGAYFFLQQEAPTYLPNPQTARGWYVLSGYASQRSSDLNSGIYGPDVSSPQSRNLDVAALYFTGPVAGGGYGGYLPSDQVPNQWLTSPAQKMLVGYPVDGSLYGFANVTNGAMYEIGPQPYPLTLDVESVTNQQEVYLANWFLGYPGNSGGPLYVQLNNYFYPAGIYLGTFNNQSVVRGIDGTVTNLITLAATMGDNGTNHNGGGVVTFVPDQNVTAANPGYLQVQITPPSALQAGAAWLLLPGTNYSTSANFTQAILSTNAVGVQFKPIPGWNFPTNLSVFVTPGIISKPSAAYTVFNPRLVPSAQGLGLTGTTNTTYRIEKTTSLKNPAWTALSTNTIVSPNFNLVVPAGTNHTTMFYRAVWLGR